MKKEVANLWIKALRSGKYKQGVCALHTSDNKYCCLGVLCDLYDKDRKAKKKKSIKISKPKYNGNKNQHCYRYGDEYDFLPTVIKRWAGMKSKKGSLEIDGSYFDLSILNDGDSYLGRKNFKEIAQIIETNVDIL
jgi:hypothetical protein